MIENEESDDNNDDSPKKCKELFNTEQLIELVKSRPALWDKHSKEYIYAKHQRVKWWMEICSEMYPDFKTLSKTEQFETVQKVQKKWYNTRDSYKKSCKKGKAYLFARRLSFLNYNDSYDKRVDKDDEDTEDFTFETKSDDEDYVKEVYFDTELEDNSNIASKDKNKTKRQGIYLQVDDVDVTPAKVLKSNLSLPEHSWIPNSSTSQDSFMPIITNLLQREDDEDRAFFNSLLPIVKKLSAVDKLEFRIRVLTTLKGMSVKKEKDPIQSDEF